MELLIISCMNYPPFHFLQYIYIYMLLVWLGIGVLLLHFTCPESMCTCVYITCHFAIFCLSKLVCARNVQMVAWFPAHVFLHGLGSKCERFFADVPKSRQV